MTELVIALIKALAGLLVIIAGFVWFRRDATKDAKLKTERDQALATAKAEQDRVKLDESINQDTDLAARARAAGVVRHTEH